MNYLDLNEHNKRRMSGSCNNNEHFEWEDSTFIEIIKGNLPSIRNYSNHIDVQKLYQKILRLCREYDHFKTDQVEFQNELQLIINEIRKIEPYWNGVDLADFSDAIKIHKFCLISGEGGIGKSYFVKCLEEELERKHIKHLCVYGKITKDVSSIDFEEIRQIGENETFVFVFDAINEIAVYDGDEQVAVLTQKRIKEITEKAELYQPVARYL